MARLTGITWDHPRGIQPLQAASAEFERRTGISVSWTARPLHTFEETSLTTFAERYDLLAIDHPFVGDAVEAGILAPLDDLLSSRVIGERRLDSAGLSHDSYTWQGRQWALAVDAACMVSAWRPDVVEVDKDHDTWDAALDLARRLGQGRVLLPANPTHLWGTFVSLCESASILPERRDGQGRPTWWPEAGIDTDTSLAAWAMLEELLAVCHPESLTTDPITALDRLSSVDDVAYVPLVFGYVTYARAGYGSARVRFANAPGLRPSGGGTLTGGVGLAVSATSKHPEHAASFLEYVTRAEIQSGVFGHAGGQPGRRSAWTSTQLNNETGHFFANTRATMERAFLRPRVRGYPQFQVAAAALLHSAVATRTAAGIAIESIQELWENRDLAAR